jgi:hypothetical protein
MANPFRDLATRDRDEPPLGPFVYPKHAETRRYAVLQCALWTGGGALAAMVGYRFIGWWAAALAALVGLLKSFSAYSEGYVGEGATITRTGEGFVLVCAKEDKLETHTFSLDELDSVSVMPEETSALSLQHRPGGNEATTLHPARGARAVLVFVGWRVFLTLDAAPTAEVVERAQALRTWLRAHKWKPADERDAG